MRFTVACPSLKALRAKFRCTYSQPSFTDRSRGGRRPRLEAIHGGAHGSRMYVITPRKLSDTNRFV